MTHLFRHLRRIEEPGESIRVAVIGAGFMGRGLIYQLSRMAGMFPALVVARNTERAVDAYRACGFNAQDVVVSDRVRDLTEAAQRRRPSVTTSVEAAASLQPLDVFIEATGAVEYGARAAL